MSKEKGREMNSEINPAEVCQETRRLASEAFLKVIKPLWQTRFSEKQLKDIWLAELRKNENLFPSGWYVPPLEGIGILIGSDEEPERLNHDSLRPPKNHPQSNIDFDPETGLIYVYASPVDKQTGVIGDWGMTVYAGNNAKIKAHLKR